MTVSVKSVFLVLFLLLVLITASFGGAFFSGLLATALFMPGAARVEAWQIAGGLAAGLWFLDLVVREWFAWRRGP